jgi:S-adenosylmethionine decarboxylase
MMSAISPSESLAYTQPVQGTHLIADLQGCTCPVALLCDAGLLASHLKAAVNEAGLSVVGETFHKFPDTPPQPGGVTGVVLLAESHVAVHTWPEFGVVTLDVYVCNYSADNSARATALMDALCRLFSPRQAHRQSLSRCGVAAMAV